MSSETELIERTYRAYFTVFQMGNPRAITPYYQIPSVFVGRAGTFVLGNVQEVEQFFERTIYALRARGYARSVLTKVQVKLIAEDLALLQAVGDRFTREGDLLERMCALYTLRQSEGTWRIATVVITDPERTLELG
jgi:hypothetical protein